MTSWELAAKAIQTGIKIRHKHWPKNEFICYCSAKRIWFDQGYSKCFDPSFRDLAGWEEYVEPKKEPEYLYEFAVKTLDERWYISPHPSPLEQIKKDQVDQKFKLLRKFDPDTLEEIIKDQNAKD